MVQDSVRSNFNHVNVKVQIVKPGVGRVPEKSPGARLHLWLLKPWCCPAIRNWRRNLRFQQDEGRNSWERIGIIKEQQIDDCVRIWDLIWRVDSPIQVLASRSNACRHQLWNDCSSWQSDDKCPHDNPQRGPLWKCGLGSGTYELYPHTQSVWR